MESALQRRIIRTLTRQGAYVLNVAGSAMQRRGSPDLLVCYRGRFIAIEVKEPGKKPRKQQAYELERIRKAGGTAVVIENMEQLAVLFAYGCKEF